MTTARNFIITIPRISEEAEDEMVALGEFSHEEEEERNEGGRGGKMVDQGVGTTKAARVLDMDDDVQSLSSSYRQWEGQQQIQRGGAAAPSAPGLVTSTQQITLALKDLQLNGPSSGPSQQQDLQQDQSERRKADVHEGGEEENQAVAGQAPIIECNRKVARPCSHPHYQQQDIAGSSSSSSGAVGVFLGVVQKTLGLGKHQQRGSVPPANPSSSLVGTAATAASVTAPTTTTGALESLPPIDAEDTYPMSESDEEGRGGGGGGGEEGFNDSEEEEELNRKRRATKKVRVSWDGVEDHNWRRCRERLISPGFCLDWWRLWDGGVWKQKENELAVYCPLTSCSSCCQC